MNEESQVPKPIPSEFAASGSEREISPSGGADSTCSCQRCSLYRWYPPMMLASTTLTAVFFWMYVTKPVLSPALDLNPLTLEPSFEETGSGSEEGTDSYAATPAILDPGVGLLPGDLEKETGALAEEEISGETLRPLIIKRNGPSLFRRFTPASVSEQPPQKIPSGFREDEVGPEESEARADLNQNDEVDLKRHMQSPGNQDSGDLRVHASIMGEFLTSQDSRENHHATGK